MRRSQAGEAAVAHHDGCDLRACGAAARGQIVGAVARDAGDETVADGPAHGGVCPVGDAGGIGEAVERCCAAEVGRRILFGVAVEENGHLLAVGWRGEGIGYIGHIKELCIAMLLM